MKNKKLSKEEKLRRRREYQKLYRQKPEVIKHRREYEQRPEVKLKRKNYQHEKYRESPKIKIRNRKYMNEYRKDNDFRNLQKQLSVDRAKAISILINKYHKEFERILKGVRNDNN